MARSEVTAPYPRNAVQCLRFSSAQTFYKPLTRH
jgi:hypothetical protein